MRARLQKVLSEYGICSRRGAEKLLAAGRVRVNGRIAEVGMSADPEVDLIEFDGKALSRRLPPAAVFPFR